MTADDKNRTVYDFDTETDRRGTLSYKWDSDADPEVIPMWVADMDFRTAPAVVDALRRRVDHGVFGYTFIPEGYYRSVDSWFSTRHGYHVEPGSIITVPGVVPAVSAIIKALTHPGDGVILHTPAYNCFFSCIRNNGCMTVESPLRRVPAGDGEFTYEIDYTLLERQCADPRNKVMLICNPHNPGGRAWTADELGRVADICLRHGVTPVSDEIHCEFVMPGHSFVSLATLSHDIVRRSVVCTSPSKAFNTAGLQIANIMAVDADLRRAIDRAVNDNEVCDVNPFGVTGLMAAYGEGGAWLDALVDYLDGNRREFFASCREAMPWLELCRLEATYLVWLDVRCLAMPSERIEEVLRDRYKVWINAGDMYGMPGYMRVNIACPRRRMLEGLRRIAAGLNDIRHGIITM